MYSSSTQGSKGRTDVGRSFKKKVNQKVGEVKKRLESWRVHGLLYALKGGESQHRLLYTPEHKKQTTASASASLFSTPVYILLSKKRCTPAGSRTNQHLLNPYVIILIRRHRRHTPPRAKSSHELSWKAKAKRNNNKNSNNNNKNKNSNTNNNNKP